jgi:hypothetical protein
MIQTLKFIRQIYHQSSLVVRFSSSVEPNRLINCVSIIYVKYKLNWFGSDIYIRIQTEPTRLNYSLLGVWPVWSKFAD